RELVEGAQGWVKMPYGDFVIDHDSDAVLFAGGTGITAFTAFLQSLTADNARPVLLAYGARTSPLLIYRDLVERCAASIPSMDICYFVEYGSPNELSRLSDRCGANVGRVSVAAVWPRLRAPSEAAYYIAGPPAMLHTISQDLRAHGISR